MNNMNNMNRNFDNYQNNQMENNQSGTVVFKTLSNISLYVMLALGIIMVLIITGTFEFNQTIATIVFSLFITCFCSFLAMPLAKRFQLKNHRTVSMIFLVFVCVVFVMLLTSTFIIINEIWANIAEENFDSSIAIKFNVIKISALLLVQFLMTSMIANGCFYYRKSMRPLQIANAVSYLFMDFYLSVLIFVPYVSKENKFELSQNALNIVKSQSMVTFLLIAVVILFLTSIWFKSLRKRSRKYGLNLENDPNNIGINGQVPQQGIPPMNQQGFSQMPPPPQNFQQNQYRNNDDNSSKSSIDKLKELKALFENGLITKEEYEDKKKDILENM